MFSTSTKTLPLRTSRFSFLTSESNSEWDVSKPFVIEVPILVNLRSKRSILSLNRIISSTI